MQVFFGGIPRAATEAQLIEFAAGAGEVFARPCAQAPQVSLSGHLHAFCSALSSADLFEMQVFSATLLRDPAMPSQNKGYAPLLIVKRTHAHTMMEHASQKMARQLVPLSSLSCIAGVVL